MRNLPEPAQYGRWDDLPELPDVSTLDSTDPVVADLLERREGLAEEWRGYLDYPNGEGWRNWLLRRAYEGVQMLDGQLRRLAGNAAGAGQELSATRH
ncbi:hypothetical protein [Amycolatopsis palatopharyngis]|uniref:hypothetical protein n=1 Tax=Amycolatopsis palatopharyngis TaxID=187982 RepID=UPI000E2764FA|nr:hypothetical protein [Amycolatopsis palatopharyngis]